MVARASTAAGFAPVERPRVAVAADGTLAAVHEPSRISIIELPSCTQFAELGTDANAASTEVAWVGTPPRLLVLSRYEAHSTVHLVDPFGPRTIAEIRLEQPMRLYSSVGVHALAIGPTGAAVLAATDRTLTPFTFPSRMVPVTAGAAGAQFMIALPNSIEEWDPQSRMPKRRLKLPRPVTVTSVGGSDRVVWMTTAQEPARIEVIPLVNRGQPKAHELPEPIAQVASHPRSDLIACIGATSGRVWVVDLDGRTGLRMIGPNGIERCEAVGLVIGRVAGVLAAQAQHATTVVALDRSDAEPAAPTPFVATPPAAPRAASTLYGPDDRALDVETPTTVTLATHEPAPTSAPPAPSRPRAPTTPPSSVPSARPRAPTVPPGTVEEAALRHYAEWRHRADSPRARTSEPVAPIWSDPKSTWRSALLAWASTGDRDRFPKSTPIEHLAVRLELPPELEAPLGLLYAQHLLGVDGLAPVEMTVLFEGNWDEALGRGELATKGLVTLRDSRLRLADPVLRILDEHPPRSGTLIGSAGPVSLLGPCVIVSTSPLPIVAEACLSSIGGAILAAHADANPKDVAIEARLYGAAPMWRVRPELLSSVPVEQPFILVADNDKSAELLGVPRLT